MAGQRNSAVQDEERVTGTEQGSVKTAPNRGPVKSAERMEVAGSSVSTASKILIAVVGSLFISNLVVDFRQVRRTLAALHEPFSPPGLAAGSCPADHQCYELPHGRLAIPTTYTRRLLLGAEGLGNFNPNVTYFAFWMPDAAPAGDVNAVSGFSYMYPDAFDPQVRNQPPVARNPPVPNPRTLVSVTFCLPKGVEQGDCFSPDQGMKNMVALRAYELDRRKQSAAIIDPARPAGLLSGTTSVVDNIDDIDRFGAFHDYFGRAGCDGSSCKAHFSFRCPIKVPYPPYQICDGYYEIKESGFAGHMMFVGLGESRTLAMAETATRLVQSWTTLNSNGD